MSPRLGHKLVLDLESTLIWSPKGPLGPPKMLPHIDTFVLLFLCLNKKAMLLFTHNKIKQFSLVE